MLLYSKLAIHYYHYCYCYCYYCYYCYKLTNVIQKLLKISFKLSSYIIEGIKAILFCFLNKKRLGPISQQK